MSDREPLPDCVPCKPTGRAVDIPLPACAGIMGGLRADLEAYSDKQRELAAGVRNIQMVGQQLELALVQVRDVIAQHRQDRAVVDAMQKELSEVGGISRSNNRDLTALKTVGAKGIIWAIGFVTLAVGALIKWGVPAVLRLIFKIKAGGE